MNTRLQITVPSNLLAAIRQLAKEERRTVPSCIVNTLFNVPAILDALKRIEEAAVVRVPEPVGERFASPAAFKGVVAPAVVRGPSCSYASAAVPAVRPDGKPYELGYPTFREDGSIRFHSCAEWQASPEYETQMAHYAARDKAAGKT